MNFASTSMGVPNPNKPEPKRPLAPFLARVPTLSSVQESA
jgi:hypothetical protein